MVDALDMRNKSERSYYYPLGSEMSNGNLEVVFY